MVGKPEKSLSQSGRVEALAFRRRLQHARRRLSLWHGRLPKRRAYRIRNPFASGVDNELSPAGLEGEVATRVRDRIRDIWAQHEVNLMKGHVAKDHVHLFVSISPQVTITAVAKGGDSALPDGGVSAH